MKCRYLWCDSVPPPQGHAVHLNDVWQNVCAGGDARADMDIGGGSIHSERKCAEGRSTRKLQPPLAQELAT